MPLDAPLDAEDLRQRLQKALDDFLSEQAAVLEDVSVELAPLVEAITALLAGGKRLRPAFCYWGWRGAGGPDCPEVVTAATSLELFHAAALVHDDVMDGSDTRRGLPAAHRRFAGLHRGNGWLGSPEEFGVAGAILLGDLCLSWSDQLLMASGLDAEQLAAGRPVYDVMRTQLMGGQYLDMLEQARADRPADRPADGLGSPAAPDRSADAIERARAVIRYKSAKYTVEHPLLLGGRLAGTGHADRVGRAGQERLLRAYSAYGLPLGEAFQLRDDVLGVFGDPSETGKPAGDDLREGKRTVLVAVALQRATPAQAAAVRRLLGDPHLDRDGVEVLREVIVDTGALRRVEDRIAALTGEALHALAGAPLADGARPVLEGLVAAATSRSL